VPVSPAKPETDPPPRELVPDWVMQREFNVSPMTIFRWDADPALGFPRAVVIRDKKYRFRHELEAFKDRLVAQAASGEVTATAPTPRHRRSAKSRVHAGGAVTG
jgi:hypothetical protein